MGKNGRYGVESNLTNTEVESGMQIACNSVACSPACTLEDIYNSLTKMEEKVLFLIAEGFTSRQISEMLSISIRTVETHRNNIIKKFRRYNKASLAFNAFEYALKKGK